MLNHLKYTIGLIAAVTFIVHCFYSQRLWICELSYSNSTLSDLTLLVSGKMRWLAFIILSLALIHLGLELSVMSLTCVRLSYVQAHSLRPRLASNIWHLPISPFSG